MGKGGKSPPIFSSFTAVSHDASGGRSGGVEKKCSSLSSLDPLYYNCQRFNKPAAAATNRASFFYDAFSCSHRNLLLFKEKYGKVENNYVQTGDSFLFSLQFWLCHCCVVCRSYGRSRGRRAIFHFTNRQLRSERGKPTLPSFLPLPSPLFCVGHHQSRSNTDPGIREQES